MLINNNQFKKVRVETQSGQYLGKIYDFELETSNANIEKFYVRSSALARVFTDTLIINKDQIVDFTDEKMIVEDSVVKIKAPLKAGVKKIEELESVEPIITSKSS